MSEKLFVVMALMFAVGCSKNKAVKAAEDMADAVCACKDAACARGCNHQTLL